MCAGFSETQDVEVLNGLLFRAMGAWLQHTSLQEDSGPGTQPVLDVLNRELQQYWTKRAQREGRPAALSEEVAAPFCWSLAAWL